VSLQRNRSPIYNLQHIKCYYKPFQTLGKFIQTFPKVTS
jgi:hypothetical protein